MEAKHVRNLCFSEKAMQDIGSSRKTNIRTGLKTGISRVFG